MISKKWFNFIIGGLIIGILVGCGSQMAIKRVNYAQPLESVLETSNSGRVDAVKHGLSFNIKPIQYKETQDTSSVTTEKVHLIRNAKGYYFLTADGYSNVYVLQPAAGSLKLHKSIQITQEGLGKPAFNQRDPYIQLIDQATDETYRLTEKGIQ
jgi:hypothetical protein